MFGARIREQRKLRGWTMKQLGQMLELAESTISGYENEIRSPDPGTLLKLAEIFGVSVDYLLGRTAEPGNAPSAGQADPADGGQLRESSAPYYAAIWDGQVETLTEEEAAHLRNSLEMFRLWKAKQSSATE